MKLAVSRLDLLASLKKIKHGVASRSAVPVLACVLLSTEASEPGQDALELVTTDMERTLYTFLDVQTEVAGSLCVPFAWLCKVLERLRSETVEIEDARGEKIEAIVRATSGKAVELRSIAYDADDFPWQPHDFPEPFVTLPYEKLIATHNAVWRAASRDETRPILTGIQTRFEGGCMTMAATNSYWLAEHSEAVAEAMATSVVHHSFWKLVCDATKKAKESVLFAVSEERFTASAWVGGVWYEQRTIDGQFPNYKQLIPEESVFTYSVELRKADLIEACEVIALTSTKNQPARFDFSKGKLMVRAISEEGQSAVTLLERVPAWEPSQKYSEKDKETPLSPEIGFNHNFLLDVCASMSAETTTLSLISPLRPGLFNGSENERFLLMPIRVA